MGADQKDLAEILEFFCTANRREFARTGQIRFVGGVTLLLSIVETRTRHFRNDCAVEYNGIASSIPTKVNVQVT